MNQTMELSVKNQRFKNVCQLLAKARSFQNNPKNLELQSFNSNNPTNQDGFVYRIPCECGKVYLGETGRSMKDRINEHDHDNNMLKY